MAVTLQLNRRSAAQNGASVILRFSSGDTPFSHVLKTFFQSQVILIVHSCDKGHDRMEEVNRIRIGINESTPKQNTSCDPVMKVKSRTLGVCRTPTRPSSAINSCWFLCDSRHNCPGLATWVQDMVLWFYGCRVCWSILKSIKIYITIIFFYCCSQRFIQSNFHLEFCKDVLEVLWVDRSWNSKEKPTWPFFSTMHR